ncbi:MAG: hypothetical protein IT577_09980 [Verrucomicrobiae bacterium]|nr:hypothetical protein [Verrucomicrobiae bacterium]
MADGNSARDQPNPFEDNIVFEPRRVERPVAGLNDAALESLAARVRPLLAPPRPRTESRLSHAVLVTSVEPGFGKSHLIGRLLSRLGGEATLVYVRPFQNPAACWRSILLRTVQELDYPEGGPSGPTALDSLACHVIADLVARAMRAGLVEGGDREASARHVLSDPVRVLGGQDEVWSGWLRQEFGNLLPFMESELRRAGLNLQALSGSWLRAFFHYIYSREDFQRRTMCVDWMKGESLDSGEVEELGIRPSDLPRPEDSASELNDLCKGRLFDLCALAGFHRPFVFCFDQTELYGDDAELATVFGMVVAEMVQNGLNQMTVVTANLDPWTRLILPRLQLAYRDRFATPPVELDGLDIGQARELAGRRLEERKVDEATAKAFLSAEWLGGVFAEKQRHGARHFLQACRSRWESMAGRHMAAAPEEGLAETYARIASGLGQKPKRLQYEPDILQWLVQEVARGWRGVVISAHRHPRGYFSVQWDLPGRRAVFGFEGGTNWRRWEGIVRESAMLSEGARAAGVVAKSVFLRVRRHPPVPGPWKIAPEIEVAKRSHMHVFRLTDLQLAHIYAAHELYANAVQGDIAASGAEVMAFVRARLEAFWQRLVESPGATVAGEPSEIFAREPEEALMDEVHVMVRDALFIGLGHLAARLSRPWGDGAILEACRHDPAIEVVRGDGAVVLRWRTHD